MRNAMHAEALHHSASLADKQTSRTVQMYDPGRTAMILLGTPPILGQVLTRVYIRVQHYRAPRNGSHPVTDGANATNIALQLGKYWDY